MNTKIPFTKDIPFEKKVSEITSISLEHEIKEKESILKGNFIVSGDYKSHEISVNKEPFSYMLPFEIELASDIDVDSIEFMIDDFTYEVIDNSSLRVNIDFNIVANKKEVLEESESIFEDPSNLFIENEQRQDALEEQNIIQDIKDETVVVNDQIVEEEDNDVVQAINEIKENINDDIREQPELQVISKEEKKETVSEDTIINSIKNTNDEYTTYHIHMVSDGETVETICTMYNSNMNVLAEYNDLGELSAGDKIIIPEKNE